MRDSSARDGPERIASSICENVASARNWEVAMVRECCQPLGSRAKGVVLDICLLILMLGLLPSVGVLAQEPPRVKASYAWAGSMDNGDGTYAVTLDITLTNPGWDDLNNLSIELVDAMALQALPHANRLAVGTLRAGESLQLFWTVTALSDLPADIADQAVLIMAGWAEDALGDPIGVAVSNKGEGQ
jgi:hypothetical protein